MISYSVCCTKSFSSRSGRSGCRSPYRRMRGGSPARKCRSEPLRSSTIFRYSSMTGIGLAAARGLRVGAGDLELGHQGGIGDVALERTTIVRIGHRVVRVDFLARERVEQGLVHELHPEIPAGHDLVRDLMRLVGLDELGHGARHHQGFADGLA